MATGDVTGDGILDVIVGSGPGRVSTVLVLDGVSGTPIFDYTPYESTFTGGLYVATGDLTGDGVADLVMTPDNGGGPRVIIMDGRTRTILADFLAFEEEFRGGASAAIADFNSDGVLDLVVGAGTGGGPRIAIFNGRTLGQSQPERLVPDFFAFESSSRMGVHVAAGDLNGDGIPEIAVGAGAGGGPRVVVIDGLRLRSPFDPQDPPITSSFFTTGPTLRGGVHVTTRDLNGDGNLELLAGSGDQSGGSTWVYTRANLFGPDSPVPSAELEPFGSFAGGVFVG